MKALKIGPAVLLRLESGEKILECLTGFCRRQKISAACFQGIGTCRRPELGYFRTSRRMYSVRRFRGEYEIAALQGNVSLVEGEAIVHAHVVISGPDFLARAGHLQEAEVLATCEIVLTPLPGRIFRTEDRAAGLRLWSLGRQTGPASHRPRLPRARS